LRQQRRHPVADDDAQALGALVERESDRLARLLTEFIDFARVRVAKLTQVDMGSVARGAANLAAAHPDCKAGVRVTCLTPEAPIVVEGDEDLLHRAAFNLALNAVQAAPAGGEVQLEVLAVPTENLPSGVTYDHGAVALRVSDNGPGIAPHVRDRLFDPFITTKPGGSGLGLPVVHRAIEAHRGCVLVDTGGRGTRFTVLLPYAQSDDGTRQTDLLPYRTSSAVHRGSDRNHIELSCTGDTITASINGTTVGTIHDGTHRTGQFQIGVSTLVHDGPSEGRLDNLVVTRA